MYFVRANRNELINCASVIKFDHKNKKIELKNGICIKISRRKIKEIKEIFTNEKTVHINI
jgi:DNA-binding LytR/AlgR family response regulator